MDPTEAKETDALLYTPDEVNESNKKPHSKIYWNEKIGFMFNKFWLYRIGIRMGYNRIRSCTIAGILFWLFCISVFGLCAYLTVNNVYYNSSNIILIYGSFGLHSGLLTGVFYAMVILLSLRYPFYWKWGLFMIGFDRQMLFHKICARLGAICCILHIVDNYDTIVSYKAITGWVCYLFALLLVIFSINYFRRTHYNGLFIYSHWVFIALFIIFGWLHNAILIIYGTFIVLIDVIIRIADNVFWSVEITNISMLDYDRVIKIDFKKKGFKYRAGQYVFIRFKGLGFAEFHPFSISSYPDSEDDAVSLHIKSSCGGNWTDRLAVYMKLHEGKTEWFKDIHVQIEGPFGELTLSKPIYEYEHVIMIGGGIGVTPLDSLFNQLLSDLTKSDKLYGKANVHSIDFVFTTRSRSLISEFASRNKSWQIADDNNDGQNIEEMQQRTIVRSKMNVFAAAGNNENRRYSLELQAKDLDFAQKQKNVKLRRRVIDENKEEEDSDEEIDRSVTEITSMSVESLDITNSTHITRVKDREFRKLYKNAYPFINFERPNIRAIIYSAASKTKSKNICVITSGPKGMINECIKWGNEIGVDVHYEVFDW